MLRELGHDAVDVRDIGLRSAPDDVIADHARSNRLTLVTRDFDFADIRNYPPDELGQVSGRLAIVEVGRVRFRPA